MRGRLKRSATLIAAMATVAAGVAGCGTGLVDTAAAAEFQAAETCDALLERLHEIGRAEVGPYGFDGPRVAAEDLTLDRMPPMAKSDTAAGAEAPSPLSEPSPATSLPDTAASGTNVQEAGVDEDDTVKAGPGRLLALDDDVLHYVDVSAEAPRLRSSVRFGFDTEAMLVEGDRVVVIGTAGGAGSTHERPRVVLAEVDVADADRPVRGAQVRIDGNLTAARSHDGVARIMVSSAPDIEFLSPGWGSAREDAATAANRRIVDATTVEDWLPRVDGRAGVACSQVMVPRKPAGPGMLAVYTVDMTAPLRIADSTALVASGEVTYAAASTMYVAMRGDDPQVAVPEMASTSTTRIHAFDISTKAPARYVASGEVSGSLKDRWAMSDAGGLLRVVTTTSGADGREATGLTTLERRGSDLVAAGHVGGLGRGEQVKAIRFAGDIGYVVTFKRTDPLWVLDLRDPRAPAVAGELHMPGYSTYLHPIDGGHLVGVGQDADPSTGGPLGLQVALYDVTDPARPAVAAKWHAPQGTTSLAEADPHAFLWWAPAGTLALPIRTGPPSAPRLGAVTDIPDAPAEEPTTATPATSTAETLVLRAGATELTEYGRFGCPSHDPSGSIGAEATPSRNVVVGAGLYTVCGNGVIGHRIDGLAATGDVRWS